MDKNTTLNLYAEAKCRLKITMGRGKKSFSVPRGSFCKVISKTIYRKTLLRYSLQYKGITFVATENYRLKNFIIHKHPLNLSIFNRLKWIFLY